VSAPLARRLIPLLTGTPRSGSGPTLARLFGVGAAVVGLLALASIVVGAVALGSRTLAPVLLDRVSPALDAGQRLSVALLDQETGIAGTT
jgi:hypothetical protein